MTIPYSDQPGGSQEFTLAILGHEERLSNSPYVEKIGRIRAESEYSPLCPADVHWNMLLVRHHGKTSLSVWGPMTQAVVMPYREGAEFLFIQFKPGTFIPYMPARNFLDTGTILPNATSKSFWLNGSAWQFPEYDNADTFVDRLVRQSLLVREPVVEAVLQDQLHSDVITFRTASVFACNRLNSTLLPLRRTRPSCGSHVAAQRPDSRCGVRTGLCRSGPSDPLSETPNWTNTRSNHPYG